MLNERDVTVTQTLTPAPHGCVFHALRCVTSRCVHVPIPMHGRIVTDRNATHEKRIRVRRALEHIPKMYLEMKHNL